MWDKIKKTFNNDKEIHILIVDDDEFTATMLKGILEKSYTVSIASNATQASKIYKETAPELAFLDIGLPDGNGLDILEEMILSEKNKTFVVMITGNDTPDNRMFAAHNGAHSFVPKPFTRDKITECLEAFHKFKADNLLK